MLPGVDIVIKGGALGGVPETKDGIAGLVLSGVAVAGFIELNKAYQIFSLKEAEDLGITEEYDTTNTVDVYLQISRFYELAGTGAELWFLLTAKTVLVEDMADLTEVNNAVKLLETAKGTVKILGFSRVPDAGYTATVVHGFDDDAYNAITKAQALCDNYESRKKPLIAVIGARAWTGVSGDLTDLRTLSKHSVGLCLLSANGTENAEVGSVVGRLAAISVQRNIGRVKNGEIGLLNSYLTDGELTESKETAWESIHDKGYIFTRTFVGKAGYFFNDDPTATSLTDDRQGLARNRVLNKAIVLTYTTYVEEVNEDVIYNTDGTLQAGYVKGLQANIESVINASMTANGEISYVKCFIDQTQNVISTNKLKIKLRIAPVGYSKIIEVEIGFENPVNNQ